MKIISSLHIVVYLILSFAVSSAIAQTPGEWTWMQGNNTINGVFGTQGIANPANTPPALYEPCEWKDNNGNFWLFGGLQPPASTNCYSALWKYDVAANQWTWMKGPSAPNQPGVYGVQGIPAVANTPGARSYGIASWTDATGDLWLHGGNLPGGTGTINDLWRYNIATNQWTWMKGGNVPGSPGSLGTMGVPSSTNTPGGGDERSGLGTDNAGNLWLFAGRGSGDNLWKYDVSTNEWTWMKGTNIFAIPAVYGTRGVAAAANTPGGRWPYASWTDLAGNLWFFGAWTQWTNGFMNLANDLWKYTVVTNQWTWVKGPNTLNDPGNYGTRCVSTVTNVPPARHENRARVRDACGNFWQFGGVSNVGNLNDLWYYNISSNEWTWVSGDNIPNQSAVNGIKGVSAPANKPNANGGGVAWIDNNGYIYVFGGLSSFSNNNNLFRYVPPRSFTQSQINSTACSPCNGSATINFSCALPNYSYVWSNGNSTLNTTNNANMITGLCPGSYTVTVTSGCNQTQTTAFTITGTSCGITANVNSETICQGTTACPTLTATGVGGTAPYNYLWSTNEITQNIMPCPVSTTIYTVTITDSGGLTATSTAVVTISSSVTATTTATSITCSGGNNGGAFVNPGSGTSPYFYSWSNTQTTQTISGLIQGGYTVTVTDSKGCTAISSVAIYSPPPLTGIFTKGTAICTDCGCKEWIMVTVTGGISPYSYSWPDGYGNRYKNHLCPGVYTINIKDKNGCSVNLGVSAP